MAPIICGLREELDVDSGVAFLRVITEKLGLRGCDAIICYAHNRWLGPTSEYSEYFEVAIVQKSDSESRMRWICPNTRTKRIIPVNIDAEKKLSHNDFAPTDRMKQIHGLGEKCELYQTGLNYATWETSFAELVWLDPPPLYLPVNSTSEHDHEYTMHPPKKAKVEMSFAVILGDWRLGLFLKSEAHRGYDPLPLYQERAKLEMSKAQKVSTAVQEFKDTKLVPERLKDYTCSLIQISQEEQKGNTRKAPGVSLISSAHRFHPDFSKSLYALDSASKIYNHLAKATVSLKLIAHPLWKSAWFQHLFERWQLNNFNRNPWGSSNFNVKPWSTQTPLLISLPNSLPNRHESFGCIALFDSGTVNLKPGDFEHSFALCSEGEIYVPAVILSDPFVRVLGYEMRSIIGNISHPGISILVSPFILRIRELSDSYNVVMHEAYDFKREDNFRETSLHLSFTDWTIPLATKGWRTIDHDTHIVEAIISVRDRGRWVADIDILTVDFIFMLRFNPVTTCDGNHDQNCDFDYTSIDSWEELLDKPSTVGIFRAHGNWAARLAAVSILSRYRARGHKFGFLGPNPFCLACLEKTVEKPG